ncbi:hypothetical protein [Streptomyces macrosporus]
MAGWRLGYARYEQYPTIVHDIAHRSDVLPYQVEAALFSHGKAVP